MIMGEVAAAGLLGTGIKMDLPFLRECFALEDDFLTAILEEVGFDLPIFCY